MISASSQEGKALITDFILNGRRTNQPLIGFSKGKGDIQFYELGLTDCIGQLTRNGTGFVAMVSPRSWLNAKYHHLVPIRKKIIKK